MLLPATASPLALLIAGAVARALASLNWGLVMARWLDRRRPLLHGAAAGLALFGFQYLLLGRRRPAVAALPALPQLADQLVYGAVAGFLLGRCRSTGT